jgi:hypothetical protein
MSAFDVRAFWGVPEVLSFCAPLFASVTAGLRRPAYRRS